MLLQCMQKAGYVRDAFTKYRAWNDLKERFNRICIQIKYNICPFAAQSLLVTWPTCGSIHLVVKLKAKHPVHCQWQQISTGKISLAFQLRTMLCLTKVALKEFLPRVNCSYCQKRMCHYDVTITHAKPYD